MDKAKGIVEVGEVVVELEASDTYKFDEIVTTHIKINASEYCIGFRVFRCP